jgi:two-component system sensor histidine kinase CiaH
MFHSARLKLTAWYSLIIITISILFSVTIFFILSRDLEQNYQRFSIRVGQRHYFFTQREFPTLFDTTAVDEAKQHLALDLVYLNLVILALSGAASFLMAGRTLRPIQQMIDDQNRFIADASHELRTPLTSLRTAIEVNLRDKDLNLKEAKELIKSNLEDVQNLQLLSDNLLRLARGKSGKNNLVEKVDLELIVDQAVKKVSHLADAKKIAINTEVVPMSLEGNKEDLESLLVILLDNAIKYSPEDKEIHVRANRKDAGGIIEIEDQGIGMSEVDQQHIFDRFFRVDQSRSQSEGYGLGLSIAKKIVDEHFGTISVKSQLDNGSTFSIFLPKKTALIPKKDSEEEFFDFKGIFAKLKAKLERNIR